MTHFYQKLEAMSTSAAVVISVALILFSGFFMTRVTKKLRLPNVTAYIVAGILIGPFGLNLIPMGIVSGMGFVADIALAFIAFSTGEFFRMEALRKNGWQNFAITLIETTLSSALVFILTYWILDIEFSFSIVLAALAALTAPASTLMTIRQLGAKGEFVDTLLQVVAYDDVVGLVSYSVAISVALGVMTGSFQAANVIVPIVANLGIMALGAVFGLFLRLMMPKRRTTDNRLIILIAVLFTFCGICTLMDVSPLLGCLTMGTAYINVSGDDKLFRQLNYFSPPILLLFFVVSGIGFRLDALVDTSTAVGPAPLIVIGVLYFLVRIVGKYVGSFAASMLLKKPRAVRNYLGLGLVPQAGVAIGLAALGARNLGGEQGSALQTVILASSVLYELVGPALAKYALYRSGSYGAAVEEKKKIRSGDDAVDELAERIREIQKELPPHSPVNENEEAFLEAAEEQLEAIGPQKRRGLMRRR